MIIFYIDEVAVLGAATMTQVEALLRVWRVLPIPPPEPSQAAIYVFGLVVLAATRSRLVPAARVAWGES